MIRRQSTARLARWQIRLLSLSGGALWLSGGAWLMLRYFGRTPGEFGPQMNPLEPWMMKAHGLALIPALLALGGLFVSHIPKGWKQPHQRIAGVLLATLLGALIASGYLLYYASGESLREWSSIAHWAMGLLLPMVFVWHYVRGLRRPIARH
jgi:hypothetical protein